MDREREDVLCVQTIVSMENASVALEEADKSVRIKLDLRSAWLQIFSTYTGLKSMVFLLWVGIDHSLWLKTVMLVVLTEDVSYWELTILLVSSDFIGNSATVEMMRLQKKICHFNRHTVWPHKLWTALVGDGEDNLLLFMLFLHCIEDR